MYILTPQQMTQIELNAVECHVPLWQLMQTAGRRMAEFILGLKLELSKGVVVACGNGNNGGDGFCCAKLLSEAGVPTTAVLMNGEPNTENAAKGYLELAGSLVDALNLNDNIDKVFARISSSALVVDCCFGTGYKGELPPQVKACMAFINRSSCKKLAADLPSGGNALDGTVAENTLRCDYTLTFANPKLGMEFQPLREHCGQITVVDIGIPKEAYHHMDYPMIKAEIEQMASLIPVRRVDAHKGDFGKLTIIAGSRRMPGAAGMAAKAAVRCGAGLTTLAAPKTVVESLSSCIMEATYLPLKETVKGEIAGSNIKDIVELCKNSTAVVIGNGMGCNEDLTELLKTLLEELTCPLVIDADGINCLVGHIELIKDTRAKLVITPHSGEMARLLGITVKDASANRLTHALELSKSYGITVVAKGAPSFVVGSNGFATLNTTGNPGLAKGGSGDVLAGMIGGFCAQGMGTAEAASAAVYFHGMAGDRAAEKYSQMGMLATDLINELPLVFREINR